MRNWSGVLLLWMFAAGLAVATLCSKHEEKPAAPNLSEAPVCTSTVSCPFPSARHNEQPAP